MTDPIDSPAAPGCVIVLVDESAAMAAVAGDIVADGRPSTKPVAERVAASLNVILNQLSSGQDCDVAIVGYKTHGGNPDVGCRWNGALAGREFVGARELPNAGFQMENRTRRRVLADGSILEEVMAVPIWYRPTLGERAPQVAALNYCGDLVERWLAKAPPTHTAPLVMHLYAGPPCDGNPQAITKRLMEIKSANGTGVLLLQAHIAPAASLVTTQYPASVANLTLGPPRDLFTRVSKLPACMQDFLKSAKLPIAANSKGMLHNAKISDVIRFLNLIKCYVATWAPSRIAPNAPPIAVPPISSTARESLEGSPVSSNDLGVAIRSAEQVVSGTDSDRRVLVLLVLDRSVDDPSANHPSNSCVRLQQQANEILKQLSKLQEDFVDVGIISYGIGSNHQVEVRSAFEGPLAGKTFVPSAQLLDGALRIEEHEEQVSNGIGGLVTVVRKTPIYYDVQPSEAADPREAFSSASRTIVEWEGARASAQLSLILLHLTRGHSGASAFEAMLDQLRSSSKAAASSVVFHLILTESPHKSLAYPEIDSEIDDSKLQHLWRVSSPLVTREGQLGSAQGITARSKGFVVNGKFDLFLECVKQAASVA